MYMCRPAVVGALLVALCLLALPQAAAALADFGPIQLQSAGQLEQFESAGEAAISGDGHYVAFEGTLAGVKGIYRKDLDSGQVQLVVGGSIYEQSGATDATAPSISDEGRYVSFTTATALLKDAHVGSNVYVRDMDLPAPPGGVCAIEEEQQQNGRRCAYELASALNESGEGLTYGGEGAIGAVASARVSLSANGREVVFVTRGSSDLTSHDPSELSTPPLQVVVRDLESDTTTLVSQTLSSLGSPTPEPVAGGAVTPSVQFETGREGVEGVLLPGAALSADGSTVAWLGAHVPAQAPTLMAEREAIEKNDEAGKEEQHYDEPLWRRIADGPTAPIRRMIGGGDPLAPGCTPAGTPETPACQGPYPGLDSQGRGGEETNTGWLGIDRYDGVPQLSADGWTAALIGDPDSTSNVFVVNMHEGLDRVQALRQLTREIPVSDVTNPGTNIHYVATAGDIYEIAISPDGSRIAFTTQRQQFPLSPPYFTEPPPAQLGVAELYEIDLNRESLVRVTHGPGIAPSLEGSRGGGVGSQGAYAPSYTDDGHALAFADTASNLVSGDANGASDVFTVTEGETPEVAGPQEIGAAPQPLGLTRPLWRLSVVPVRHSDGSVTLDVVVPGAGELSAQATAEVPVAPPASTHKGHVAHAHKGHTAHADAQRKHSRPVRDSELQTRTVASAREATELSSLIELPLRVSLRYAQLLRTKAGIYATVHVTFRGDGGPTLAQVVTISLRKLERKAKSAPVEKRRRGHTRKGGRR
jgi:Tol biopolymer transport system component